MANEPSSPHSRRLSSVVSFCLAYGYIFVVFSTVGGVFVGFALMAFGGSGLPSDVRRVIGIILLIDGLLAGVTGLFFIGLSLGSRPAARSPKRELHVFLAPQGRAFEVSGTIVSAPTYQAPLSQRPCVLWHIQLLHLVYIAVGGEIGGHVEIVGVWSQSRLADVEIRYDRTRTIDSRPDALSDGQPTVTDAPGGTITIPSGAIRIRMVSRAGGRAFPINTATLQILDELGLPAELHKASAEKPYTYKLMEYSPTTGDFVAGSQQPTITSEQWMPDPNAPFELSDISREQGNTFLLGVLAVGFIVGMLVLLGLGYGFLQR